jgi:hypothetical protein
MRTWLLLLLALAVCACAPHDTEHAVGDNAAAVVRGGDGGRLPRALPADEKLDPVVLERAIGSESQRGVSALLIARHGHLILERYSAGLTAESLLAGGDMSAAILALCVGVARDERTLGEVELGHFDAARLQSQLVSAVKMPYANYVSRQLWQPLNAASASLGDSFSARAEDWLRVGMLLIQDGRFEGEQIVSADWVKKMRTPDGNDPTSGFGIRRALSSEHYEASQLYYLNGMGHTRLWLLPALQLVILRVDAAPATGSWDAAAALNPLLAAVLDQPLQRAGISLLNQLVPGH